VANDPPFKVPLPTATHAAALTHETLVSSDGVVPNGFAGKLTDHFACDQTAISGDCDFWPASVHDCLYPTATHEVVLGQLTDKSAPRLRAGIVSSSAVHVPLSSFSIKG
jgi:hypothetical protein